MVAVNSHAVGGAISGLTGTVELQNNGGETLSASTDGPFTFATAVDEGNAYAVSVTSQPVGQTCSVNHGSGTVGTSAVTNVAVVCAANAYPVGGSVLGLIGSVTLLNNGTDNLSLNTNGGFTFATSVAHGASYNVTVQSQPVGQTCTVSNGSGTLGAAAVTNVTVTCHVNTYTVGGTVSGLVGSVLLQNNGADTLALNSDGAFTFATPVASGSSYNVTVSSQPPTQTCTVSNGTGSNVSSNITNVAVTCTTNTTTLSVSATHMSIAVGGAASTLNVTNTGSTLATNVAATLPAGWTSVTQDASACTAIAPGDSCTLSFTSTDAYVANGAVAVVGGNTTTVNTAMAFTVGGFLVYEVTGPNTGRVVSDNLVGPYADVAAHMGASSRTDGEGNTTNIIAAVDPGMTSTAAGACRRSSGPTWSLPAVCELSSETAFCASASGSVSSNLWRFGFGTPVPNGIYWTSTEADNWMAVVVSIGIGSLTAPKAGSHNVRCVAPVTW